MATLTCGIPKLGPALTFTAFFTLNRPLNLVRILCLSSLSNDKRKPKFKKIKIKKSSLKKTAEEEKQPFLLDKYQGKE